MNNKMKKCKTCGADFAKSAKFCPQCGAKNPRGLQTFLIVVVILIALMAISSAINSGNSDQPKKVENNTPSNETLQTNEESPNEETPAASPPEVVQTPFTVGDTVELNDIRVTFVGVSNPPSNAFSKPADGKIFVACEFTIENNSSKDIAISSLLSFEAYIDDFSTNISIPGMVTSSKTQLDGSVAAGKKMNGIVAYEAPEDWENIEIRLKPDFWSGKEFVFVAES